MMPVVWSPRSVAPTWTPLRASVTAPTSSTSDTATWLATSPLRSVAARVVALGWPRSAWVRLKRVARTAGASANSNVAHDATISAKRNTRPSRSRGTTRTSAEIVGGSVAKKSAVPA